MDLDLGDRRATTLVDVALYLLGLVGLAAALTITWLSMRAVLDIGGYCADGGPYEIATHCPDGVGLLLTLSIFGGLGCAGLAGWKGAQLGAPYDGLILLAWPALFISLGFNFLQYALFPAGADTGIELGFLIPGILFVIMGAVPLIGFLPGRKRAKPVSDTPLLDEAAGRAESNQRKLARQRSHLLADMRQEAELRSAAQTPDAQPPDAQAPDARPPAIPTDDPDLVGELERLTALYRAGSLNYDEFQRAKQALIDEAGA